MPFSESQPSHPSVRNLILEKYPISALLDLEACAGFRTLVLKQVCARWQKDEGVIETVTLEYDELL